MQHEEVDNLLSKANAEMQALRHSVVVKYQKRAKILGIKVISILLHAQ